MRQYLVFPRNNTILIGFFCLFTSVLSAQNNSKDFWSHMQYGGGIGLSFSGDYFSGTLAPSAIYRFNQPFALGVSLNATYASRKDYYRSTILGGSILGLYNPIPQLQFSVEFEELHVNRTWENRLLVQDEKYWYPALFLGAGYAISSGRVATAIGVRYDVLYDEDKSIYGSSWMPFFRIYF